jgi:hypothetical protein
VIVVTSCLYLDCDLSFILPLLLLVIYGVVGRTLPFPLVAWCHSFTAARLPSLLPYGEWPVMVYMDPWWTLLLFVMILVVIR